MVSVSIRDLSHQTSQVLRRVKAGETIEVTERGKVIGRIVPASPADALRDRLIAEGRMKPATGDRESFLRDLRRRLATEPIDETSSGTAALLAMREEERY